MRFDNPWSRLVGEIFERESICCSRPLATWRPGIQRENFFDERDRCWRCRLTFDFTWLSSEADPTTATEKEVTDFEGRWQGCLPKSGNLEVKCGKFAEYLFIMGVELPPEWNSAAARRRFTFTRKPKRLNLARGLRESRLHFQPTVLHFASSFSIRLLSSSNAQHWSRPSIPHRI